MSLKERFSKNIRLELLKKLGLSNLYAVPTVDKIIVNSGIGEAVINKSLVDLMLNDLTLITGQKAVPAKAKKDVSNFNRLKKGDIIGVYVTLRGRRMWDFLEKLIVLVLPGIKDFRGLSKRSFDGHGNYSLGIKNHMVFPEVDQNRIDKPRGVQVTIVTTTDSDEDAYILLKELGMPFVD